MTLIVWLFTPFYNIVTRMKIVTVIPIVRGTFREYLTYFSGQEIEPGDLVTVPLRNKPIAALVLATEPLAAAKADLKQADFGMKKVTSVRARRFLSPQCLAAAQELADYYATPLGPVLKSLLPAIMLESKVKPPPDTGLKPDTGKTPSECLIIQDTDEERLSYYKNLTREAFARGKSIFVCLPTAMDLRSARPHLERGIAHYTVELHNHLSIKELKQNWERALTDPHPLLIIGSPIFLSVPRNDLATIIVDRESSAAYRPQKRPLIDYRRFAELLARKGKIRLCLGDILLRPETMYRLERGDLGAVHPPRQRLAPTSSTTVVSAESGELWSDEAKQLIQRAQHSGERLLILTNRRGLAPLIVCDDCGESVTCGNCGSPLVLHQANIQQGIQESAIFRCHHCGETRTSEEKCKHCQSWRLRALGTGIERVAKELKTLVPKAPIFQIDSDQIKTLKRAEEVMEKFWHTPGAILLGTEMALNYLKDKVTYALVVTIDAMLALPDYRINEKAFTLLSRLRAATAKDLLIQSRQTDNQALQQMARGQLLDFYRHEIAERERFDYPPFRVFIKITAQGPSTKLRAVFHKLAEQFADYEPAVYPSFHQPGRGLLELNLLIKLKPEEWPDPELSGYLKRLPSEFAVTVDPESIL